MMDLKTTYMGLPLKHPIVVSASPLTAELDNIRRMEDAGAAAVVMFSLFEEQIKQENEAIEHFMEYGSDSFAEALSYFRPVDDYYMGTENYLELIRQASEAVDIPVIGSLNGITDEGWIDYARQMENAGASGIELNIYYIPADVTLSGREVEQRYLDVVKTVKNAVSVPVALKLSPFFSAMGHMARELADAGADALVLFNRFYQPDFNLAELEVSPSLELSSPSEIRLPLLWIAVLYGRVNASLAATTGVHSSTEAIKYLLAGADAVMTTAALLKNGIQFLTALVDGIGNWMEEKQYASLADLKGSMSHLHLTDPSAFERANYIKILENYKSAYLS